MFNSERETADKQLTDGTTPSTAAHDCAAFFCTTLASLNEIALDQMSGLLNIAITAASAASSLSSSKSGGSVEDMETTEGNKLAELAGQLRSTAEELRQNAESVTEIQRAGVDSEAFCMKVDATLNVAMQNSASLQQQLNTLGQAILAQAAVLLLTTASTGTVEG
jgi:methylthioribose-1-phosphate isomerase